MPSMLRFFLMALLLTCQCIKAGEASDFRASFGSDITVLDQAGRHRNFRRDLLGDGVVAINFIFTRCAATCPLSIATFRSLRKRAGPSIRLISVSVDPRYDTPERLRAYADRFQATNDWHFVTGDKSALDKLLRQLGIAPSVKEAHSNDVLVGNASTGRWTRLYGLPGVEDIVAAATDVR